MIGGHYRWAIIVALIGCTTRPDPAPLPDAVLDPHPPSGLMVRFGGVQGFIARPSTDGPHTGLLLAVEHLTDHQRTRALSAASKGIVTLVVQPDVPIEDAQRYLQTMPDMLTVETRCEHLRCPGVAVAP